MPLFTMLSIAGTAAVKAACAFSLSPDSMALMVAFKYVRTMERMLTLRLRFVSAWRARFFAWGELAKV